MKHTFLFCFILFCYFLSSAQNVEYKVIGFKSGLSTTKIIYNDLQDLPFSALNSFSGGLSYEHYYENGLFFVMETFYNPKGQAWKFSYTDQNGEPLGGEITSIFRYNYFSLPVKTGYSFGNDFFGTLSGGVVPSYLLSTAESLPVVYDTNGNYIGEIETTTDINPNTRRVDLAGLVEVGAGYKIKEQLWLTISIAYQYSFTPIVKEKILNMDTRHHGLTSSLAVKYVLKK